MAAAVATGSEGLLEATLDNTFTIGSDDESGPIETSTGKKGRLSRVDRNSPQFIAFRNSRARRSNSESNIAKNTLSAKRKNEDVNDDHEDHSDPRRVRVFKKGPNGREELEPGVHFEMATRLEVYLDERVESKAISVAMGTPDYANYSLVWRCGTLRAQDEALVPGLIREVENFPGITFKGEKIRFVGLTDEELNWKQMNLYLDTGAIFLAASPTVYLEKKFGYYPDVIKREDWRYVSLTKRPGESTIVRLEARPKFVAYIRSLGWRAPLIGGKKPCYPVNVRLSGQQQQQQQPKPQQQPQPAGQPQQQQQKQQHQPQKLSLIHI